MTCILKHPWVLSIEHCLPCSV